MIIDGQHKYIRYIFPNRIEELYDIEIDPDELTNLAVHPGYADRLGEMRKTLIDYLKQTGGEPFADLLPPPKTGFAPAAAPVATVAAGTQDDHGTQDTSQTRVFFTGKNRQAHTAGCRRLSKETRQDGRKAEEMTWAEAQERGHIACSKCQAGKPQCGGCRIARELCECRTE
jgi:hypothetical protein